MILLVESIKKRGIITPAIVRRKQDGRFELIAGHRRKHACKQLGIKGLRCEVWNLTDDEAIIIMVESNWQRTNILPSEKAFAYKMWLDANKRQGKSTDLTCAPLGYKLKGAKTVSAIAEQTGDSKTQIQRYIRLTYLIPELLTYVDEGKIKLRPAVELSYLDTDFQYDCGQLVDKLLNHSYEDNSPVYLDEDYTHIGFGLAIATLDNGAPCFYWADCSYVPR